MVLSALLLMGSVAPAIEFLTPPALPTASTQNAKALEARAARSPNAYNFRILADAYLAVQKYQAASGAFMKASELYRKAGDPNAAEVLLSYAKRYETSIRVFVEEPLNETWAKRYYSGAKFEPLYGCLVGVNNERDSERDPEAFDQRVGKKHATFFMYRSFGTPFPSALAAQLREMKAGLQIAWEPKSLEEMDDPDIVSAFAEAASRSGIPVFLRFASEMNGPWTRYSGNPSVYRQKFRNVARMVHEIAPNVAMVWCPNEAPKEPIESYYPGPEAVDWVGVNFYSVLYNDGDRSRAAEWRHPADSLDYIYAKYSVRHPIMVGEWAATHHSVLDPAPKPQFARTKIGQFYAALPRLYPRVKAVHWLSMDTMTHASGPRKLNNFSLLDDESVAAKYRDVLTDGYFLESMSTDEVQPSPKQYVLLKPNATLPYGARLSLVVRSYEQEPVVTVRLAGTQLLEQREVDDYRFTVSSVGKGELRVIVRDSYGRIASELKMPIAVK